jgi:dTDP-4-amino-4,6-dideoxygalactose transaminase
MYAFGKAEIEALTQVVKSGKLFRYRGGEGGWCDRFEAELAQKIGVKHALLLSSGTAALTCALVGVGIKPGDEVIVPAYTFMASALAVTAAGGIPIVAEIDESLMLDPRDVERKITRDTKAIIPVHMVGRVCDMGALLRLARRRNLIVVEDACQAVGGSYRGRRLCSLGRAGAFSFNFFKIIGCGEGGAMLTSDLNTYDRGLIYHDGGAVFRKYAEKLKTPFFAGSNFRVSELQGAFMYMQLRRLDGILQRLRARAAAMREALAAARRFRLSPSNEIEGDCGVSVPVQFDTPKAAQDFVQWMQDRKCGSGFRPIDTGRHVYYNWEPIMKQQGAHCAELNPYRWARRKIVYARDMCPRSIELMSRSVLINVPYAASVGEARLMARKMV